MLDNFNTHTKGAFGTAFSASWASDSVHSIGFCYKPNHGNWLNIAEMS